MTGFRTIRYRLGAVFERTGYHIIKRRDVKYFLFLAFLLLATVGCGDDGYDPLTALEEPFLTTRGCLSAEAQTFTVFLPADLQGLMVQLTVEQGQADLIVGTEEVPLYFSLGSGTGTQRIRVGADSYEPMNGGNWSATVVSPAGVTSACDPANPTDWQLVMDRAWLYTAKNILEESCEDDETCVVEDCETTGECPVRVFTIKQVPDMATALEVTLESIEGDADLFVYRGDPEQAGSLEALPQIGSSTNPGTGFDVVQLGGAVVRAMQGEPMTMGLKSWGQTTGVYKLKVSAE